MPTRKEMKKRSKHALKRHYFIYLAACLIAAFLGAEFTGTLRSVRSIRPGTETESVSGVAASGAGIKKGIYDVYTDIVTGDTEAGKTRSEAIKEAAVQKAENGNPALGRTRGVFAQIVNNITSGTFLVTLASAIFNITGSKNFVTAVFLLGSMLLSFSLWFLLTNMYRAVSRRIFLEGRTYEKVSIQRFLYFYRVKKWIHVSWVMFVRVIWEMLWWLTIAGGVIKHYSYYMVPYIIAENPTLSAREAVTLSRQMMKGHKWECFVNGLSFLGWNLLGIVTFGLLPLFFTNLYESAFYSEYYAVLRHEARKNRIEGFEKFNDTYLFEPAPERVLRKAYADVYEVNREKIQELQLHGFRGFLARWFGVVLTESGEERACEKQEAKRLQYTVYKSAAEGLSYPGRLHPIPEREKRRKAETILYTRFYSVWSVILLFFTFSFIGWLWEVSLHLISDGEFVNRGVLHGPWLPIYGTGGVLILLLLNRLRKKPVAEFFGAVVLCGIVEYFTAWALELTHNGMKWWDYSGYFLNLHGRICAEGLLMFGLGGIAIVYVAAPMLDNLFRQIPKKAVILLCVVLAGIFVTDTVYSKFNPNTGKGITSAAAAKEDSSV